MSKMVTRCPQCQTAFKITDAQLAIANGAVRCGACLHVFQARQHWVVATNFADLEVPAAPAQSATVPVNEMRFPFDQANLDRQMQTADAVVAEPAVTRQPLFEERDYRRAPADDTATSGTETASSSIVVNESWARELISGFATQAETEAAIDAESVAETSVEIEEVEALPCVDISGKIGKQNTYRQDQSAGQRAAANTPDYPVFDDTLAAEPPLSARRATMIAHIDPAPVEMAVAPTPSQWKMQVLWTLLAALLLALALAQYVFFHFDQLVKQEETRPWLQSLCRTLGCSLPLEESWRTIKISQLLVRPDPSTDALAVEAVLLNEAEQPQPFPKLDMYFQNLAQQPVASRRFEPKEYLGSQWAGKTMMPVGQPVHIAFDLVKPDEAAVNWSLQVAQTPPSAP